MQNRHLIPFDDIELSRLISLLTARGVDNVLERLARVRSWTQIVYTFSWTRPTLPPAVVANAVDERFSHTLSHSDASIITGIRATAIDAQIKSPTTPTSWARLDDPSEFAAPRSALDYVRMQVKPTSTEQVASAAAPLSHWVSAPERGYMPALLDFVPPSNFASYELLLESPKEIYVPRIDISLTAIKMQGF